MEVFLPQVPLHVLKRIADKGEVTPGITPTRSALLFTDISGFTALTETLTATGKEGIEEITQILNDHFGRLSGILDSHKGVLLKLGGDSLLARFADEDALSRATEAAKEMLGWFKEHPTVRTTKGEFRLSMKAILGGGDYFEAILGSKEKTDWFPLGKVVQELAAAEKRVEPGELIVRKGLEEQTFKAESYPALADDDLRLLSDLSRSFLPLGRSGRLVLTRGGEYRVVAPIFLEVSDYDPDNPDFKSLNDFYLSLYRLVDRYHGAINKIDISPEGSKFLILFGAPVSHASDRSNAAAFFNDLQNLSTGFQLRAGLAYGATFAGFIGGTRKEYTVIGQRVNSAAKVMAASGSGEFVVTAEAASKFSDLYESTELEPVQIGNLVHKRFSLLEKKKDAVTVLGEWSTHEKEIELCEGLAKGESRIVGITGDHGMGKSRFLRNLGARLEPTHTLLEVSLDERGAPYQVFRRMLMFATGIKDDDPAKEKYKKLTNHLRDVVAEAGESLEGNEILRRFPFIAGMLFGLEEAQKTIAPYSPELRVENLMDAFRSYILRRASSVQLAVLCDDLGRADSGSVEMLSFAARTLPRLKSKGIFFFFTYNPEFTDQFNQAFPSDEMKLEMVTLNPLTAAESRGLVHQLLEAEADDSVHQFLYQHSLGNPTVIEQWTGYLIDKDLITKTDGQWGMKEGADTSEIPDDLYSLVFSRLDRLPEHVSKALKLGAVYGSMHFPASIIGQIMEHNDVRSLLAPAVSAGLVYPLEAGEVEYVFRQSLVRDVCYDSVLRGEREQAHRQVASAIERLYAQSLERYYSILADHWSEAQVWPNAFGYCLKSAKENRRLFRNEASLADYGKAVDIWKEHFGEGYSEEMFDAYFGRGMVFTYQGQFKEASSDYDAARMISIKKGFAEKEVDALNKLAYTSRFLSDFDSVFKYSEESLNQAEALGYTGGKAVAHLERGTGFAQQGKAQEAGDNFESALNLAEEIGDAENANRALNNLATLNRVLGRPDQALSFYKRAIMLAEKSEDKFLLTNNILNIARLLHQMGRLEDADSYLERALKIAMEIGHRATIINCTMELATLELGKGNHESASQRIEEAMTRAKELHDPELTSEVYMRKGWLAYYAGKVEEALESYQSALTLRKNLADPNKLADTYINLGNACLELWQMEEGRKHLERAYELCKEVGNPSGASQSLATLSSINLHLGRFSEALEHANQALEIARQVGDSWGEAEAKGKYAEVSLILARYEEALENLAFADELLSSPEMLLMAVEPIRLRAMIYNKLGRFKKAQEESSRCLDLARRGGDPDQIFLAKVTRLEVLIGSGDVETAVVELIELQEMVAELEHVKFQIAARLIAARINLANRTYPVAAEVLSGLEKEYSAQMDVESRLNALLLLARSYLGDGRLKEAERYGKKLLESIGSKPLLEHAVWGNLVMASLAAKRLKFVETEDGTKKPKGSSWLLHPVVLVKWRKYQKTAAKAAKSIIKHLSAENARSFAKLCVQGGLAEKLLET
ncbi:tetratricopeptide repeat protein [candidate division WOR-3 bacterium]|uniref:Tetratricopeptide repeat protein n=1 Tax=candidate division WOR-3 bacterium TaxID=2052148 RepID=A0A9D5KAE2_UNCW3|nr:tetratricopeptide repeat protein [candidate division WOR-3 bacterium]MBD3365341.1 tetratricopeptide repeat protein [candidate division WOR-3 bacterium]